MPWAAISQETSGFFPFTRRRMGGGWGLQSTPMSPASPVAASQDAELDALLGAAMERLERALASDQPAVAGLARHAAGYRGKMLRPRLVLLACWGLAGRADLGPAREACLKLAATLELVHLATLVHDDVLDEAALRRGGATLNTLHGNEAAVMLGDWLLSRAYRLCAEIGVPEVAVAVADATSAVCAGEILQLAHRNDWDLGLPTYDAIIEGKTAALTAACCRIPALLFPGQGDAAALHEFGLHLGAAFQMADDILDLASTDAEAGKTLGRDLAEGKLTLPVLLALGRQPALRPDLAVAAGQRPGDPAAAARRVLAAVQAGDAGASAGTSAGTSALVAARAAAEARLALARAALGRGLPPGPARTRLEAACSQVLDRRK